MKKKSDWITLFMSAGLNIKNTCSDGKSLSELAIQQGWSGFADTLTGRGASPSMTWRSVILSYQKMPSNLIGTYINSATGINEKDEDGRTPILIALDDNCDPMIINTLIKQGAAVDIVDNNKNNILHHLIRRHCDGHAEAPYKYFNEIGGYEFINYALSKGVDVNLQNRFGYTPLYYVVDCYTSTSYHNNTKHPICNDDLVRFLIKKGARLDVKNEYGWSLIDKMMKPKYKDLNKIVNEVLK